jgi:hypothetical protein
MWMNEDDYQLRLYSDLKSAVNNFNLQYQNGPVLFKRTLSSITKLPSLLSPLGSTCTDVAVTIKSDAARACDEAKQLVCCIERFRSPRRYRKNEPSVIQLFALIGTLSRGTFLSNESVPINDSSSLVDILHSHLPLREIDNIVYEYLDSGVHGMMAAMGHTSSPDEMR